MDNCVEKKLGPYLSPGTKSNSKKVKPETLKILEENTNKNTYAIGRVNDFLDITSAAQTKTTTTK